MRSLKKKKIQGHIKESPLFWPAYLQENTLYVLDETLLPGKMVYVKVTSLEAAVKVIREMKTRAFGQFLVVLNTFLLEINRHKNKSAVELLNIIRHCAEALNNSRPTFPFSEVTGIVVVWAQKALEGKIDMHQYVVGHINGYLAGIRAQRLDRVVRIAKIIKSGDSILTHCNVSGELAMAAGLCLEQKKDVHFFATETRPYLQGAKLTVWELERMGAKVTLIADNAVASVMADGLVNKVIVGSDRNCANGDFANKIGTYQIAVLAQEFGLPFYVLTQPSQRVKKGDDIPIEMRKTDEVLSFENRKLFKGRLAGFYPGFDVVPHKYVTKSIAINVH